MKNTLLVILSCFTLTSFSQLYFADRSNVYYYVDIRGDSARIEIFKDHLYVLDKKADEMLAKNSSGNILFGSQNKIVKHKKDLYLIYKEPLSKELLKVKLEPCMKDIREKLRKEAYYCLKGAELSKLQDSLAGPSHRSDYSINRSVDSTSSSEYFKITNAIVDSLSKEIKTQADPTAQYFYSDMDSLYLLKQTEIFALLKKARYDFHYGQCLLYNVASVRPEILIAYVDKNLPNKPLVLKTIRDHAYFREINSKVKASSIQTYAKSEILKQKRKRIIRDKAGRGTIAGLIIGEIALIAVLVIVALK